MVYRKHFQAWPAQAKLDKFLQACNKWRTLTNVNSRKKAFVEELFKTDIRIVKYFHPFAAVFIAYRLAKRLEEMVRHKKLSEEDPTFNSYKIPDEYNGRPLTALKKELSWVREFIFKWDREEMKEGKLEEWMEFIFPDSKDPEEGEVIDPDDCPDCYDPRGIPRSMLTIPIDCSECVCALYAPLSASPPVVRKTPPASPPPAPIAAPSASSASPEPAAVDDNATQGISD